MTSLNVSLPEPMRAWVEEKVAKGGYSTASELVRELIRDAQKHDAQDRLESLALAGLDSGPAFEMTEEHWERLRAKIAARVANGQEKRP
jgi:antitoxin ParD1/3/4